MCGHRLSILLAPLALLGCQLLPLPTNQPELPPPAAADFPDVFAQGTAAPAAAASGATATANAPATPAGTSSPAYDPFTSSSINDQDTATKFAPTFVFTADSTQVNGTPGVTTDIYQTKGELEVRQVNTLIEHAGFHFEKLKDGMLIGGGQVDVGTPPKLSVPIEVRVDDTDGQSYAVLSVKSNSLLAKVYLADLEVKVLYGSLSIVSVANASRANDKDGIYTTPASIRVVQKLDPGYVQLPATPQTIRSRVIITSEQDPGTRTVGQRVYNNTLTVTP